jgi:hypothetical protein
MIRPNINTRTRFASSPIGTPLKPYSPSRPYKSSVQSSLPSPRVKAPGTHRKQGYLLLFFTIVYFVYNLWAIVFCRYVNEEWFGNSVTREIVEFYKYDHYYCYLVPMFGPVFCFFTLFNWLGMKFFKHNA